MFDVFNSTDITFGREKKDVERKKEIEKNDIRNPKGLKVTS